MATGSSHVFPYGLAPGSAADVLRGPPTPAHDLARSDGGGTGCTRGRPPVHPRPGTDPDDVVDFPHDVHQSATFAAGHPGTAPTTRNR